MKHSAGVAQPFHIAGIYALEHDKGVHALVMELSKGQRSFDLHSDGERVAMGPPDQRDERTREHVTFVFNLLSAYVA